MADCMNAECDDDRGARFQMLANHFRFSFCFVCVSLVKYLYVARREHEPEL